MSSFWREHFRTHTSKPGLTGQDLKFTLVIYVLLSRFLFVIAPTHDKQQSSTCCLSRIEFHHAWLNYNRLLVCASLHQQGQNIVKAHSLVLPSQLTTAPPWNSVLRLNSWGGPWTALRLLKFSSWSTHGADESKYMNVDPETEATYWANVIIQQCWMEAHLTWVSCGWRCCARWSIGDLPCLKGIQMRSLRCTVAKV